MKRRKFLKLLGWTPVAFLIPKMFIHRKPLSLKQRLDNQFVTLENTAGDGGYVVPKDIARKLIAANFDIHIQKTIPIKLRK